MTSFYGTTYLRLERFARIFSPIWHTGVSPQVSPGVTMPLPCTVCQHLKRNEIDILLARQVVNVVQLGRTYGLADHALRNHRKRHLPGFLPAFTAQADGLTLSTLTAEAQRLYMASLDALATAEAGVLQRVEHVDHETGERYVEQVKTVSISQIGRAIREARASLTQLTQLSATQSSEKGAPIQHDSELGAAIHEQLIQLRAERKAREVQHVHADDTVPALDAAPGDAEVVEGHEVVGDERQAPTEPRHRHPGTQDGQHGASTATPPLPRDAVASLANPVGGSGNPTDLTVDQDGQPNLSVAQIAAAARAAGVTPDSLMQFLRAKQLPRIVHPEWTGNPAASKEERAAAGYADVPIQDHRFDDAD